MGTYRAIRGVVFRVAQTILSVLQDLPISTNPAGPRARKPKTTTEPSEPRA
jgi:hypothetical protein